MCMRPFLWLHKNGFALYLLLFPLWFVLFSVFVVTTTVSKSFDWTRISDVYPHLWNCLKYFLSMWAMCFSWNLPSYCVFQSIYTCYALYWDIREDWGLFWNFKKGKYFLLRKEVEGRSKHLMPERYFYYIAMAMNVVLRWMWVIKLALVGELG